MKLVRDILLLLVLIAVGAGVVMYQRNQREELATILKAASETRRLEMEVKFRAATKGADLNARGWPLTIEPSWFEKDPPINTLVGDDRPWIEIAAASEADLQHPSVRMTIDDQTPAFWYNPYQGVVRARVPVMVNDESAAALYNRINESALPSIFWIEKPPPRVEARATKPDAESGKDDKADEPARPEPQRVIVRRTTPGKKR